MFGAVPCLVLAAAAVGCSDSGSTKPTPQPTIRTYDDIQVHVFDRSCLRACHDQFVQLGELDLSAGISYEELVNVKAVYDTTVLLVEPYSAVNSGLVKTIEPSDGAPRMPPGEIELLTEREIEAIRAWIDRGAPRDE
jgi:hypothetical protein